MGDIKEGTITLSHIPKAIQSWREESPMNQCAGDIAMFDKMLEESKTQKVIFSKLYAWWLMDRMTVFKGVWFENKDIIPPIPSRLHLEITRCGPPEIMDKIGKERLIHEVIQFLKQKMLDDGTPLPKYEKLDVEWL